jgi:NAD(P)-dependent dehydrogenase (short-subunit alcohol dehydrogenase family)
MTAKNYIVIGGSYGIGFALTQRLSTKGHQVWVGSRTSNQANDLSGVTQFDFNAMEDPLPMDLLPDAIHGLAYCPGSIRLRPFRALKEEEFLADFQLNVLGAVKAIQACLKKMNKAQPDASVVLFSTVAVNTGMPFHASIASAKGAVEGLTRSLAAELAPHIRVNAIAPSLTDTPLAARLLSNEEKKKASADRHPLKRIGDPEDLADAALFLLEDSSSWITGQIIGVDGGLGSLHTR